MSAFAWTELSGRALPGGFTLKKVILETPYFALFRAQSTSESLQPEATVEVVSPQEPPGNVVNRFLEASYFRNPNLAGISAAGILEDRGLVYAIAEPVDHTLSDFIAQRPLPADDAIELIEQLLSGLAYLHSENLVFCNLRPEAIWRTAASWKLGDFSQLRMISTGTAGGANSKDLRAALARRPDLPPEVYEGVVTPAWDVWSLGVLLRRILAPLPVPDGAATATPRGRQLRQSELPAPFDSITRDCLDPNPETRITLEQIRSRLHPSRAHNSVGRPLRTGIAPAATKDRVLSFFRKLPDQPSRVKALLAVLASVLLLAVLVSANSIIRHGGSDVPLVSQAPVPIVVSEADRAAQPAPETPAPARGTGRISTPDTPSSSGLPGNIKTLLDTWLTSTRNHDLQANLDCYAPIVDTYYNKRQLSRNDMRREKQRQFQTIGTVRRLGLDNLQFTQLGPDQAVLLFDKQWSFGDRNPFSGSERAQLSLRNVGGNWKIVGERELKVYWVRRGRQS